MSILSLCMTRKLTPFTLFSLDPQYFLISLYIQGTKGILCTLNTCTENSALLGHCVLTGLLKISHMNKVIRNLCFCHDSFLISLPVKGSPVDND